MRTGNRVVQDNAAELQYELLDGGDVVGVIRYRREPGAIALVHTDVDPKWEGKGVGAELVQGALDDVRARGLKVRAFCPFVAAYIRHHPAYRDLVVA